jgi:hypothetical protein
MADTNHSHAHSHAIPEGYEAHEVGIPVQPDGVSFVAVFWSVAIMFITTIVSGVLVVGVFKWLEAETKKADTARAPLSAPQGQLPPAPNLLQEMVGSAEANEPGYLAKFRAGERARLQGYAFDQAAGAGRIPIDHAKDLLIERGVLVGTGDAPDKIAAAPAATTPAAAPAAPAHGAEHAAPPKAH